MAGGGIVQLTRLHCGKLRRKAVIVHTAVHMRTSRSVEALSSVSALSFMTCNSFVLDSTSFSRSSCSLVIDSIFFCMVSYSACVTVSCFIASSSPSKSLTKLSNFSCAWDTREQMHVSLHMRYCRMPPRVFTPTRRTPELSVRIILKPLQQQYAPLSVGRLTSLNDQLYRLSGASRNGITLFGGRYIVRFYLFMASALRGLISIFSWGTTSTFFHFFVYGVAWFGCFFFLSEMIRYIYLDYTGKCRVSRLIRASVYPSASVMLQAWSVLRSKRRFLPSERLARRPGILHFSLSSWGDLLHSFCLVIQRYRYQLRLAPMSYIRNFFAINLSSQASLFSFLTSTCEPQPCTNPRKPPKTRGCCAYSR